MRSGLGSRGNAVWEPSLKRLTARRLRGLFTTGQSAASLYARMGGQAQLGLEMRNVAKKEDKNHIYLES